MYTFKEWLNEAIDSVSIHKDPHISDLGTHDKHSYRLHDQNGHKFATADVYHQKDYDGKKSDKAVITIQTHGYHPDAHALKRTTFGPKFSVHPKLVKHVLNQIGKYHTDIKHFEFDRGTGSNYLNNTSHNLHTVKNPHFKQED